MFDLEWYLLFVGLPLAIVAVLALLTLGPGAHRRPRYKPGQPWEHAPVWFEPHPGGSGHGPAPAHGPAAVPGGSGTAALGSSIYPEQPGERTTDSGSGAGPAAGAGRSHGATARAPQPAGPLGGARGTW